MKKLKEMLCVLIALVICFGTMPAVFALSYGNFEYVLINEGTEVEITNYVGKNTSFVDIPSSINGLPVTSIGERCFDGHEEIENIKIPVSINHFGDFAFRGTTWLEEQIDEFLVRNNILIKYNGNSIGSITLPNNIKTIGYGAFEGAKFNAITLNETLAAILDYAFFDCPNLKTINLPKSLEYIGSTAFKACAALEEINVDEDNSAYSSNDGVLFTKNMETLLFCPQGKLYSYIIPDGVKVIALSAFELCTNLSSVTIPESITQIPDAAFYKCNNLKTVTINGDITKIGDWAFAYCTSLSAFNFPQSLETIGYAAFMNCDSLNNISISSDIKSIDKFALGFYLSDGSSIAVKKNNFSIHINNPEGVKYIDTEIYKYISDSKLKYTVEHDFERELGDVNANGKVDTADARLALRAAVKIETLTQGQLAAADLDGNGIVSVAEARKILRVAVKIDLSF